MIKQEMVCLESKTTHPNWLLRPAILPDEMVHSYAHRILILNSVDSMGSLRTTLANAGVIESKTSPLELLAYIAGVDISEFVQFHTLLPFKRAFFNETSPRPHREVYGSLQSEMAFRGCVRSFSYCVGCIREDQELWGFPILRVSHHVPGIEYCEKHAQTLISDNFYHTRASEIHKFSWPAVLPPPEDLATKPYKFTQRYAAFVTALMARTASIPIKVVCQVIHSQMEKKDLLRTINGRKIKYISDLALAKAPRSWLSELFPIFLEQEFRPRTYRGSLDGTASPAVICTPVAYAIALLVLFSKPEEALGKLELALQE